MIRTTINLGELGRRLGYVVAMYSDGKAGAMAAADISEDTLHRYLTGKSERAQVAALAAICEPHNINLMWLVHGDRYPKYSHQKEDAK